VYDELRRKWAKVSRAIRTKMRWQDSAPIWPVCLYSEVSEEPQNAINAVMAKEGVPARARLRNRDPQNAKWRLFDDIEVAAADGEDRAFNETLATFAVSADIHLATTHGWDYGAARRHRSERERRLLRDRRRARRPCGGQLEPLYLVESPLDDGATVDDYHERPARFERGARQT
jgi:hypothetical protein